MELATVCLFDFDGVLVDSEPAHAAAKRKAMTALGIPVPEGLLDAWQGRTDADFAAHVAAVVAPGTDPAVLLEAKRAAFLDAAARVALVPGAPELLPAARRRFRGMAIATSATRRDLDLLAGPHDLPRWFDAIVTGDDTVRHKPDPEPYLVALARLGASAREAVAIEDSPNGIRSAAGAGVRVIGLAGAFTAEELRAAGAARVVHHLDVLATELGGTRTTTSAPCAGPGRRR